MGHECVVLTLWRYLLTILCIESSFRRMKAPISQTWDFPELLCQWGCSAEDNGSWLLERFQSRGHRHLSIVWRAGEIAGHHTGGHSRPSNLRCLLPLCALAAQQPAAPYLTNGSRSQNISRAHPPHRPSDSCPEAKMSTRANRRSENRGATCMGNTRVIKVSGHAGSNVPPAMGSGAPPSSFGTSAH